MKAKHTDASADTTCTSSGKAPLPAPDASGFTMDSFIDSIPDPVYYKDCGGRYVGCNAAFAAMIGKKSEEIIGATDYDLFPQRIAERFFHYDTELIQNRKRQVQELRIPGADGTEIQVLIHRNVIVSQDDDITYLVGTVIDITNERREEHERSTAMVMAAAAEMAIQTIEGMIDPVIILNAAGRIERVNKGYAELFGLTKPVIGKCLSKVFVDFCEEDIHKLLKRCMSQGRIRNLEKKVRDAQGNTIPVLINVSMLRDSQRAVDGFIVAIRDISSLVHTTEQLREKERKLDAILNASEDAVILMDTSGVIKSGNRALADRYGNDLDCLLGHNFSELPDKGLCDIRSAFIETIVNSGKPNRIEYEQDGKVFYNSGFPIFDGTGSVEEVAIFSYDITEQKQGERLQRALYSISEAAYFAQDIYSLFRIVHRIVARMVPAESFQIVLRDNENGQLSCPYSVQGEQELPPDKAAKSALSNGIVEFLLRSGRAMLLKTEDLRRLSANSEIELHDPVPKEWLGVPLRNGDGTLVGALITQIHKSGVSYNDEDRRILNFVSSQIAMAIERKMNEETLRTKNALLKGLTDGTIMALVKAVEIRDPYTAGHQQRVSMLSEAIARKLGLNESRIEATRISALLHDVGKIAVPSELLSKPGKLSELEFELIRQHPVVSYDILRSIQFPYPIAQYALEHHEKINGSGYPAGLRGSAISLESRIICVADVVDAIASHRPYRPSRGLDLALAEIEENTGELYDTDIAEACLELFRKENFRFSTISPDLISIDYSAGSVF